MGVVYLNGNSASVGSTDDSQSSSGSGGDTIHQHGSRGAHNASANSNSSVGRPLPRPVPIPRTDATDSQWPRNPMTSAATVTVHIEGHPEWDFKTLIRPSDTGATLFEALAQRLGKNEAHFNPFFFSQKLSVQTPLKDLGFINGDIIAVQMV